MFKPIAVLLTIGLAIPGDAAAQPASTSAHTAILRKDTLLKLDLLNPLDPATAKVGDDVPLRLARPLVVDGITLLPADEVVHGRVTKGRKYDKCGDRELDFALNRISFADSSTARTKVFSVSPIPDAYVPENLNSVSDSHFTPSDVPGAVVVGLLTLPLYLLLPFARYPCSPQKVEPANSTVEVVFTKDHRVRY